MYFVLASTSADNLVWEILGGPEKGLLNRDQGLPQPATGNWWMGASVVAEEE